MPTVLIALSGYQVQQFYTDLNGCLRETGNGQEGVASH